MKMVGMPARQGGRRPAWRLSFAVEWDRGQLLGEQEKRGWGTVSLSSQQLAS